jgi:hypothetical protein
MPTLSHRAPVWLLVVTGASLSVVALAVERRAGAPALARLLFTSLGWCGALVLALAVMTGLPQALAGGVAPRLPGWTGLLAAAVQVMAGAMAGTGSFLALGALRRGLRE